MKKLYILILLILTFTSCNVLDQVSPNSVPDGKIFTSKLGAEAALVGMYSSMQARDYYGGFYPLMADLYSDVGNDGGFDNVALDELSVLDVTTSNIMVENTWISIYYTISVANNIINRIDGIVDADFTTEERNSIKGQALGVRALAHFDLLRMFGEHWNLVSEYGIPVVTTVQKANDVVARSTVAETYTAIIEDLNKAYQLLPETENTPENPAAPYISSIAIKALLARVYLYKGDMSNAVDEATTVIDDGTFKVLPASEFKTIYTQKFSKESIFEITFDIQNRSAYNATTYSRRIAQRTEVLFLADSSMNDFFANRPGDLRTDLVNFVDNDITIAPDGRTQKYRGEDSRDNDAQVIRMAEIYLIRAEAKGLSGGGLDDLNYVRENRGLSDLTGGDIETDDEFLNAVLDERKAELNFEGHRMFDLARTNKVGEVLGAEVNPIFPIPYRETIATKGVIKQNPGYEQ